MILFGGEAGLKETAGLFTPACGQGLQSKTSRNENFRQAL